MAQLRLGVVAFWKDYDRKAVLRAAQLADDLGYDSFWLPEAWGYDCVPLLTEVALRTRRIKLGTGILNVFSRTPALLAMTAATLSELSEGRFILGLGTSGKRVIEGFHGREFKRPLTQTRDVIKVVKGLLAGERLNRLGAELSDYRPFALETTQSGYKVPVYVAALKEKSIKSVGELADGWMPTSWPYRELDRGLAWLREGAERSGRTLDDLTVAPFTGALPVGKKRGLAMAKEVTAFYIGGMGDYYRALLEGFGWAEECETIANLYANKATRAQATDAVPDALVADMMVAGDPLSCLKELRRRQEGGFDLQILGLPPGAPYPAMAAMLHALAPSKRPSAVQLASTAAVRIADRF